MEKNIVLLIYSSAKFLDRENDKGDLYHTPICYAFQLHSFPLEDHASFNRLVP